MAKTVEIEGIIWYPEIVKKMDEDKFISSHITIHPFNSMDDKKAKVKANGIKKLKEVYKQIK
jgi:hypothetical protein